MKTPEWKIETIGTREGFSIELRFDPEFDIDPRKHLQDECGWSDEEYEEIADYYWFSASVVALRDDEEFGWSYLGGNCYKSKADVMESELGGYMPQMIDEAISDAKESIAIELEKAKKRVLALS